MGSYLPSAVLAGLFGAGLVLARPLVSLNLRVYGLMGFTRLAAFCEERRESHIVFVRFACALAVTISVLEMIFRRAYLG
jgi:hypothetical protein